MSIKQNLRIIVLKRSERFWAIQSCAEVAAEAVITATLIDKALISPFDWRAKSFALLLCASKQIMRIQIKAQKALFYSAIESKIFLLTFYSIIKQFIIKYN